MAELTTLARPYAKAAFEHAQAHQQLASWSAMLGLAAAVSQDDTMQRVLKAPRLTSADKAATFIDVCGCKLRKTNPSLGALSFAPATWLSMARFAANSRALPKH